MKFHRTRRMRRALGAFAFCVIAGLATLASAQQPQVKPEIKPAIEPAKQEKAPEKAKDAPLELTPPAPAGDPHEEMERLFGEIELKMRRVNRLLEEAAAGKPGDAAKELDTTIKTIDELLNVSTEQSRSVIQDIDKILELASHPHAGGT